MNIDNISNINNFIKDIIDYNDSINIKYFKYINYKYLVSTDAYNNMHLNNPINLNNSYNLNNLINVDDKVDKDIIFYINDEKKYCDFEILGIYDYVNNIWIWGWVFPDMDPKYVTLSKYLLEYGLKININNMPNLFFIKTLLTNSRILINSSIELEINMAIVLYLLKNKVLFIYKNKDKNTNIIAYYLIKNLY